MPNIVWYVSKHPIQTAQALRLTAMYDPGTYTSVITAIVFIKKPSRWFTRLYACLARIS